MWPTLLNLLGVDAGSDVQFGNDLFAPEKEEFVVFRDGRFVTNEYVYAGKEIPATKMVRETPLTKVFCEPYIDETIAKLEYSDNIIIKELLRFYNEETGELRDPE